MVSFPYYSHIFRDSYGSGMGIVWEAGILKWDTVYITSFLTPTQTTDRWQHVVVSPPLDSGEEGAVLLHLIDGPKFGAFRSTVYPLSFIKCMSSETTSRCFVLKQKFSVNMSHFFSKVHPTSSRVIPKRFWSNSWSQAKA